MHAGFSEFEIHRRCCNDNYSDIFEQAGNFYASFGITALTLSQLKIDELYLQTWGLYSVLTWMTGAVTPYGSGHFWHSLLTHTFSLFYQASFSNLNLAQLSITLLVHWHCSIDFNILLIVFSNALIHLFVLSKALLFAPVFELQRK